MKKILFTVAVLFAAVNLFAQSDDDFFFDDDGILEMEVPAENESASNSVSSDLKKGVLFQDGNVKIGGSFSTSISTLTTVYADDDKKIIDNLSDSKLTPEASAYLTVDARPNQNLRMYSKFGMAYPFTTTAVSATNFVYLPDDQIKKIPGYISAFDPLFKMIPVAGTTQTVVSDWLSLKELFTDFSIADTAFFRFGVHTVTWGAGYFFSPVSDLINTTSINPEDTDAQVDGCLNLRTQIVFPNTQNCLWLYVIPSTDFVTTGTVQSYTKKTGFAGKGEVVLGNWELGAGGFWRYEEAPKLMATVSGSIGKLNVFGEGVYQYGAAQEWKNNSTWGENKSHIFQATAGCMYNWKNPSITLAAQYYYDSNSVKNDFEAEQMGQKIKLSIPDFMEGHNAALLLNFGRLFGTTDLTATVFGMVNIGRSEIDFEAPDAVKSYVEERKSEITGLLNSVTASAMLSYTPITDLKISAGPYMTIKKIGEAPVISAKITFNLGGGKF